MPRVLVCGDFIEDRYRFGSATRLCPEAPVPVVVPEREERRPGGAALVAAQLDVLGCHVTAHYGSFSRKERIFAGSHLVCRVDYDSLAVARSNSARAAFESRIWRDSAQVDAIVVSDYGKGAMTARTAHQIVNDTQKLKIPLFVDAKNTFNLYTRAFAIFPNEHEFLQPPAFYQTFNMHTIRKLGSRGCSVDGNLVPTTAQEATDVTGAGDTFIAAFVLEYLNLKAWYADMAEDGLLRAAARFANKVAGLSVKHIGTHVVTQEEIDGV